MISFRSLPSLALLAACAGETKATGTCPTESIAYTDDGLMFTTLKEAVDTVSPGAVIRVCPGEFVIAYTAVYGRDFDDEVSVAGAGDETTLSGGNRNEVLAMISPSASVRISDLTITSGYRDPREYCGDVDSSLSCPRTIAGTGLGVGGTHGQAEGVTITNNEALYGAGIQISPDSTLTIRNSRVTNNRATYQGGAAVIQEGGVLVSENTTWEGNTPDDIIFATIDDDPGNVVVHASWNADGATDFTCRFDTLTCE